MSIDVNTVTRADLETALGTINKRRLVTGPATGPGINIPLTNQTDPRRFPNYAPGGPNYSAFPKMVSRAVTEKDVAEWTARNRLYDRQTKEEFWAERPPVVGQMMPVPASADHVDAGLAEGIGLPLMVRNKDEEHRVYDELGIPLPKQDHGGKIAIPLDEGELSRVLEHNKKLAAAIAERDRLQAELDKALPATDTNSVKSE